MSSFDHLFNPCLKFFMRIVSCHKKHSGPSNGNGTHTIKMGHEKVYMPTSPASIGNRWRVSF